MGGCFKCGGPLEKVHRNLIEKLFASHAYHCLDCNRRSYGFYRWWFSPYRFAFSHYTRCPKCGTHRVHRMNKRDPLDSISMNPLSLLQRIFGAPRNKCPNCRMQYHDARSVMPRTQTPANERPLSRVARSEIVQP